MNRLAAPYSIHRARPEETPQVSAVLQEAARWLADSGKVMWNEASYTPERLQPQVEQGRFHAVREDHDIAAVVRLDDEDPLFWPEMPPGTALYLHSLAVRRAWAGCGLPQALLASAAEQARARARPHLRLDCRADRQALRTLYEGAGFRLHSEIVLGVHRFARYEMAVGRAAWIQSDLCFWSARCHDLLL